MRYLTIASVVLLATVTLTTNICKATIEAPKITRPTITKININKHPVKKQTKDTIIFSDWLRWVEICSKKYGVDKHFALAVAECESSNKHTRFRFGKMGRGTFYGPYGIKNIFMKKWRIDDAFVNTDVGIRALGRYGDQKRSLKKYNASFNMAYYKRIKYLERKNREDKVFSNPELLVYKLR